MDIPIKMIDFATAISWVFLITFFASAIYSIKDLRVDFGDLQEGMTPNGRISFSLPVNLTNNGYYNVGMFNLTTKVLDGNGSEITEGSTVLPAIRIGENLSILHNMTFDASLLLQPSREYLFNDTQLNTVESISMKLGGVIPVSASTNFSIPWGAPLYDLKLGDPLYHTLNQTDVQVTVPLSFDNHAFFDIVGEARIRMYNSANQLIGFGQIEVKVLQHSHYEGGVELRAEVSSNLWTGRFELEFQTSVFSFGPLVIPHG